MSNLFEELENAVHRLPDFWDVLHVLTVLAFAGFVILVASAVAVWAWHIIF